MTNNIYPKAYACYNTNLNIRLQSTSGGVFTLIGNYVIQQLHGVVFGAAFKDDFSVHHIGVKDINDLGKLRGSKYPQSLMDDTYTNVQLLLNKGTVVLFTGTPCQIEGLKAFLRRDYDNLLCMDFVCHGVASDRVWKDYIIELKKMGEIKGISFKSKPKGWKKWYFKVEYNDYVYQIRGCMNKFMKSYLNYCNIRPSCYTCHFKGLRRNTDFTISDCWGIGEENKDLNDNQGLSALLIQTERGNKIFNLVKHSMRFAEYPANILMAGNWTAVKSVMPSAVRDEFFKSVKKKGTEYALCKYFKPTIREWLGYYYMRLTGKEK